MQSVLRACHQHAVKHAHGPGVDSHLCIHSVDFLLRKVISINIARQHTHGIDIAIAIRRDIANLGTKFHHQLAFSSQLIVEIHITRAVIDQRFACVLRIQQIGINTGVVKVVQHFLLAHIDDIGQVLGVNAQTGDFVRQTLRLPHIDHGVHVFVRLLHGVAQRTEFFLCGFWHLNLLLEATSTDATKQSQHHSQA